MTFEVGLPRRGMDEKQSHHAPKDQNWASGHSPQQNAIRPRNKQEDMTTKFCKIPQEQIITNLLST